MALDTLKFRAYDGNRVPKGPFALNKDSLQAQGLAGWWPLFGENFLEDKSGHRQTARLQSSYPMTGFKTNRFGAHHFDGSVSGYLDVADSPTLDRVLNIGTPRSLMFWCRYTSTSNLVISEKGTNRHCVWQIGGSAGAGKLSWSPWGGGGNFVTSTITLNDDIWHHAAGTTASGTGNVTTKIYIEGQLNNTKVDAESAQVDDNSVLVIGARAGNAAAYTGDLFDFRIYDWEVTPEFVAHCFNPSTRWDLYHQPGKVLYFLPPAAVVVAAGAKRAARAPLRGIGGIVGITF